MTVWATVQCIFLQMLCSIKVLHLHIVFFLKKREATVGVSIQLFLGESKTQALYTCMHTHRKKDVNEVDWFTPLNILM